MSNRRQPSWVLKSAYGKELVERPHIQGATTRKLSKRSSLATRDQINSIREDFGFHIELKKHTTQPLWRELSEDDLAQLHQVLLKESHER